MQRHPASHHEHHRIYDSSGGILWSTVGGVEFPGLCRHVAKTPHPNTDSGPCHMHAFQAMTTCTVLECSFVIYRSRRTL